MNRQHRRALRPALELLDDRCLLTALTPAQVTNAYGLNNITFSSNGQLIPGNGSGQTIAIVDVYHDPYLASDLNTFDQANNLPAAAVTQVDLAGSSTDSGWAEEETLDVEWAHAIAPGANIVVIEAPYASLQALLGAVNVAQQIPGVSVVSLSWGGSESLGQTLYDGVFTTPAGHTGITYVAASGDQGAAGGASWPASSPNVLSVGATTLTLAPNGTYMGESVWPGSGGGYSYVEAEPAYQSDVQLSGTRTTPDVSFVGDPNTGVEVYTTDPATGLGSWYQVGGTSVGAPAWAGIIALADQGRALAGEGTLDSTQTLSALYSLPSSDFHQVSAATSFGFGSLAGAAPALGSPNGAALVNGLVAYGSSPTNTSTATIAPSAVSVPITSGTSSPVQTPTPVSGGSGHRGSGHSHSPVTVRMPHTTKARGHRAIASTGSAFSQGTWSLYGR
ncbi:MAG: S53 family peptidase [Planctomycetaceae bacterium]|nr:S53 family peptidase [Planctomycetaceae bacterium]